MSVNRRTALQLLALPVLPGPAARAACALQQTPKPALDEARGAAPFFSSAERALLADAMELIIPADEHSPGARAARTDEFADKLVAAESEQTKALWRNGLARLAAESQHSSLLDSLVRAAANEAHPQSELDHFFVALKRMTIDGYYTSEIGIHTDLGYIGNQYQTRFDGCTHPEHLGPSNGLQTGGE